MPKMFEAARPARNRRDVAMLVLTITGLTAAGVVALLWALSKHDTDTTELVVFLIVAIVVFAVTIILMAGAWANRQDLLRAMQNRER